MKGIERSWTRGALSIRQVFVAGRFNYTSPAAAAAAAAAGHVSCSRRRWHRSCLQSHSFTEGSSLSVEPVSEAAKFSRSQTMSSTVRPPAAVARTLPMSSTVRLMSLLIVLLGSILSVAAAAITSQMSPREIQTQYGRLRGLLVSIADRRSSGQPARRVEVYLGLQYASLEGGKHRFMPPTGPMEKWDGVRVALKHRPVCPQPAPDLNEPGLTDRELARRKRLATFVEKQLEECLTLNIYVPARGQSRLIALTCVDSCIYEMYIHGVRYVQ